MIKSSFLENIHISSLGFKGGEYTYSVCNNKQISFNLQSLIVNLNNYSISYIVTDI